MKYYSRSGEFANCIVVKAFASKAERDQWVADETSDGHHTENRREAITAREARSIMAHNRQMTREHKRNSGYPQSWGTEYIDD